MSSLANERVAYFNGQIVPESQVLIPFRDRGFKYGDAVFDMTRTFGHRIFKLKEHVDRLYKSLAYLKIDPQMSPAEMMRISQEVLERNLHLIGKDEDYWVGQRISRGVGESFSGTQNSGPTVIVECLPLPLKNRAPLYRDGIDVIVPSVRRTPPDAMSPRAKTHNYINLILADLEARAQDAEAWAVLLDQDGNLCEGLGSNVFVVTEGRLLTPRSRFVLPGISRGHTIEAAESLGIPFAEADIDLYDAYTADEMFLTSTSLCICPVRSINGRTIGDGPRAGKVPGPVTKKLIEGYAKSVDFDFMAQYLRHLA
ncbi:aminotransferase class IV [Oceanibaculum sp.]|uniref:aminotransferase class IV n=1 Tax=Oceanibaculum sp. TaxID=1903597 RepID=UPI00258E3F5D|nr:aminotransferase class IV [Oceanibaculum sp.]MCH2396449.1 aminotransferase class IV [Oceanibaculum sp.]